MCGQEFDEFDEIERFGFHHRVGLGSCFYSKIVECELCCSCFDRMMKEYILPNCKIDPIVVGCLWTGAIENITQSHLDMVFAIVGDFKC